jgi:hypothetical protein
MHASRLDIEGIATDTAVFLWNTDRKVLHGGFVAVKTGTLDKEAWGGRFLHQACGLGSLPSLPTALHPVCLHQPSW